MFSILENFLVEYKWIVIILHVLGAALGVGGATVTDILFFKFLRDHKISRREADIMNSVSKIIWIALGLIIVSGIALYLPASERLNDSAKFMTKMIAVIVLVLNGIALNMIVAPRLVKIYFGDLDPIKKERTKIIRRLSFALGAISITSWYFVFILGSLRSFTLNFQEFMMIYLSLILLAILGSQLFERNFSLLISKR